MIKTQLGSEPARPLNRRGGPPDSDILARFAGSEPPPFLLALPQQADRAAVAEFRRSQVQELLACAAARVEWLVEGDAREGLAVWRLLAWDSELFGFPAARLDLLAAGGDYALARARKRELLARVLEGCAAAGVRHLTARASAADLAALHALEQAGFETIDGIQTFALAVAETRPAVADGPCRVAPFEPAQLEGVLEIARRAYSLDRFHADPALGDGVADRVHEEWMRHSCRQSVVHGAALCPPMTVMVASRGGSVWGFVSVRCERALHLRLGTIVLVATAAEARGCGVARQATYCALAWMRRRSIDVAQVGTQLANVPAARLYESCGFRLAGVHLTLRKLL